MKTKHLISAQDLEKKDYDQIVGNFDKLVRQGIPKNLCEGKVVATLFFQPSTRTMTMFQSAIIRSGGGWVGVTGQDAISMSKGESLEDTIREYGSYADCIVLRHPDDDSAERAANASFVPVLNGGSGAREHGIAAPWVICLMSYYLKKPLDNLKIGIYGAPGMTRIIKSLVPVFGMYKAELYVDDLEIFPLPKDIEEKAKINGLQSIKYDKLDNFIGEVDVLFVTKAVPAGEVDIASDKILKEKKQMLLEQYKPITTEHMKKFRKDACLFMIKPRTIEIDKEVDADPRATYSKQEPATEIGLALITHCLGVDVK